MWISFNQDTRRRIRPNPAGIVTSVIDYKAGTVANVPREYGERLVAEGKARATVSPAKKDTDDGATAASKPRDGSAGKP